MRVGTKSVLFGAHCFFLHPWFVARAWAKLYGFPWDIRLWFAFFLHDIGYFGKPNMDGEEGETHPLVGARIMRRLFGDEWGDFVLLHSRYYAKKLGRDYSRLCVADKMAIAITPAAIYIPMVRSTGEIMEYRREAAERAGKSTNLTPEEKWGMIHGTDYDWFVALQSYMRRWALTHVDGKEDLWTKARS